MISNKSKAAIALGIIMLSNLTITHAESKIISSNETILSNNLSNNSESSSNANLSYLNNEASSNDAITTFNVNSDSALAFNNDYYSNIVTKNNSSNEVINSDATLEDNSTSEIIDNDVVIKDNSSNIIIDNNIDMQDTSSTETIDNNVSNEDNYSNDTINNDVTIEDNSSDNSINNDINIAKNDIFCPELSEAPLLTASDGFNKNGIGDSVYDHLKDLGWTAIDSNTINVNDGRLQFKNMNGLNNIDSIITIRCDFEENDKYILYLLKLMIGDKSISTATPSDSEIFSGAFDDTYYDNFENLVRRIANGSGTINYSNRSIRVQYDGKLDYTITLTFSNYNDNTTESIPSIEEDNGNIIYSEVPEI